MTELRPGTIIKLKNLTGANVIYNDQIGIVKKRHDEQRWRIMMHNSENDLGFKSENFEVLDYCVCSARSYSQARFLWPRIQKEPDPVIHPLKYISEELEALVQEVAAKFCRKLPKRKYVDNSGDYILDQLNRDKLTKINGTLSEKLGWVNPVAHLI